MIQTVQPQIHSRKNSYDEFISLEAVDINSFLKLERRTSAVYRELLSKKIIESSAYKLPESLKKIYEKSVTRFKLSNETDDKKSGNSKTTEEKKISNGAKEPLSEEEINANQTPSPLRKKQHIVTVLSICRQSLTNLFEFEKENKIDEEDEALSMPSVADFNHVEEANNNVPKCNFSFSLDDPKLNGQNHMTIVLNNIKCPFTKPSESFTSNSLINKKIFHTDNGNNTMKFAHKHKQPVNGQEENGNCNQTSNNIDNSDHLININMPFQKCNIIDDIEPGEKFCSICKEDENNPMDKLISICQCTGVFQYTHTSCIKSFLNDFQIFKNEKKLCDICKTPFRYEIIRNKKCQFMLRENLQKTIMFLVFSCSLLGVMLYFLGSVLSKYTYSFISILIIATCSICIVSLIYQFGEILQFKFYEEWVLYTRESKPELKTDRSAKKSTDKDNRELESKLVIIDQIELKISNHKCYYKSSSPKMNRKLRPHIELYLCKSDKIVDKNIAEPMQKNNNDTSSELSMFNDSSINKDFHDIKFDKFAPTKPCQMSFFNFDEYLKDKNSNIIPKENYAIKFKSSVLNN